MVYISHLILERLALLFSIQIVEVILAISLLFLRVLRHQTVRYVTIIVAVPKNVTVISGPKLVVPRKSCA